MTPEPHPSTTRSRAKPRKASSDEAPASEFALRFKAVRGEIGAIDATAEEAALIMLGCAEQVIVLCRTLNEPAAHAIREQMLILMSACSFRDLTGQRLSNMLGSLAALEKRMAGSPPSGSVLPANSKEQRAQARRKKLLLNGPQLAGDGLSQEAVDLIFS